MMRAYKSTPLPPRGEIGRERQLNKPSNRMYALLTSQEIVALGTISGAAAIIMSWFVGVWDFYWILGFAGFLAPLVHFCLVSTRTLAFPLFLPAIFALQHVVSTAHCYLHPEAKGFPVSINAESYFPMAVMATWLMYAGVLIPMFKVQSVVDGSRGKGNTFSRGRGIQKFLMLTFWCGIVFTFFRSMFGDALPSMAFVLLLLSRLSYVSVIALAIVGSRRFNTYIVLLACIEGIGALQSSIFHPILFFFLMIGCVAIFSKKKWAAGKVAFALLLAAFAVYSLQCVKGPYRERIMWENTGVVRRLSALYSSFYEFFGQPEHIFSQENRNQAMDRFDQGQIVSLVMRNVPSREPFARGETIKTALRSALIPRIFSPGKYRAGGSEFFERFTGIRTGEQTSVNLGQLAEFYANYGRNGALIGCAIYALLLGLIWRFFHTRAVQKPLWWAFFPYVAMGMVKTEDGLGEVTNYLVKASMVSLAIIMTFPGWKKALLTPFWKTRQTNRHRPPQTAPL